MVGRIVRMSRTEQFSACHRLHSKELDDNENAKLFGKCNNKNGHGHNYKWEVTIRGAVCEQTGMVYDLAELKEAMAAVMETVDHKNLDLDVEYFRSRVSTTENLTSYLWSELEQHLRKPELLYKITVWETDKNKFTYKREK
ncbi:hypothetical protein AB6A40_002796 [Gnathostoma spinigerum]|uniref:6-pyruvoyl tetrahydrobiopterin synthase n=1 Tax=Gnathostoma spinigerum TaxID=75299 RepID=A0ABD6EHP4_9BILA